MLQLIVQSLYFYKHILNFTKKKKKKKKQEIRLYTFVSSKIQNSEQNSAK